jgi:hypothetical protein
MEIMNKYITIKKLCKCENPINENEITNLTTQEIGQPIPIKFQLEVPKLKAIHNQKPSKTNWLIITLTLLVTASLTISLWKNRKILTRINHLATTDHSVNMNPNNDNGNTVNLILRTETVQS